MNQSPDNSPLHWENPRICATCTYFYRDHSDPITPGCPACHQADQLNNQ